MVEDGETADRSEELRDVTDGRQTGQVKTVNPEMTGKDLQQGRLTGAVDAEQQSGLTADP